MRIVTWNVYWLQGAAFADFPPGTPRPQVLTSVAALLAELNGDLLCIQELQSFEAAGALASAVRAAGWFYRPGRSPDRPQYGGAVLARDGAWSFAPVADAPIERFAIKAVRPADGACVANVHLRSDRFASTEQSAAARRDELLAVLDGEPRPHVVCGDFNAPPGDGLYGELADRGFLDAAARSGLGDGATTLRPRQGDRIWIADRLADRLVAVEPVALERTRLSDEETLSDHLPVVVEIRL